MTKLVCEICGEQASFILHVSNSKTAPVCGQLCASQILDREITWERVKEEPHEDPFERLRAIQ